MGSDISAIFLLGCQKVHDTQPQTCSSFAYLVLIHCAISPAWLPSWLVSIMAEYGFPYRSI